jgi:hypothetical protein
MVGIRNKNSEASMGVRFLAIADVGSHFEMKIETTEEELIGGVNLTPFPNPLFSSSLILTGVLSQMSVSVGVGSRQLFWSGLTKYICIVLAW